MRIYFIGICGTAMGNAALLLREMGHEISGSDAGIYEPMSSLLRASQVQLFEGFDGARIVPGAFDLVVVGNAIARGNPEVEQLLMSNLRFTSLPALLREFILRDRHSIVITGTHGKTTTTTLAAYLLAANGREPGYFIGGVPKNLPNGARLGATADPFVIEGDEYDSAFFDKRSKFIHYFPSTLVINNLEFDHGDIFRDLDDIKRSFNHLMRIVPSNGRVIINADDVNVNALPVQSGADIIRVSAGSGIEDLEDSVNAVKIVDFRESREGAAFDLFLGAQKWASVSWGLTGLYNARNAAMAAVAAAFSIFPEDPTQLDLSALSDFTGVKRRQDILFDDAGFVVMEDFGHHPSAIVQTLNAIRDRYPGHNVTAVFEPRSNTGTSEIFQKEFINTFLAADCVFLGRVHRYEILSHGKRLETGRIAESLEERGVHARAFKQNKDLLDALKNDTFGDRQENNKKNLVVFFTNGSFDGIIVDYVESLKSRFGIPC